MVHRSVPRPGSLQLLSLDPNLSCDEDGSYAEAAELVGGGVRELGAQEDQEERELHDSGARDSLC